MNSTPQTLQQLRAEIDILNEKILALLNHRAALASQVGAVKVESGDDTAYRPEREAQVLRHIAAINPGPLSNEVVSHLFREIMSACLALEKPITVAYLGPSGTFTEAAAIKHFGMGALLHPCPSIDEVYRAVESGAANFAVVPVENTTEGAVGRSLDLMPGTPLMACGEIIIPIHQNLMAAAVVDLKTIKRVYSHSQSLAQCHEWLNNNLPEAERIAVASNAEAARRASIEPGSVALAGERAAEVFHLTILSANIEDEPNNTTRFLVMGHYAPAPSGKDKTSLVLSASNHAGAVYEMITPLAKRGVSMCKFESRPSKIAMWEYLFFVDVEGHQSDKNVAEGLAELKKIAGYLKVIGSYPVAVM